MRPLLFGSILHQMTLHIVSIGIGTYMPKLLTTTRA